MEIKEAVIISVGDFIPSGIGPEVIVSCQKTSGLCKHALERLLSMIKICLSQGEAKSSWWPQYDKET